MIFKYKEYYSLQGEEMTTKTETTNTQIPSDAVLVFYALRHEKSLMNLLGYGEADSPLADAGRRDVPNLARVVWHIGVENIDAIISGTLSDSAIILSANREDNLPIESP